MCRSCIGRNGWVIQIIVLVSNIHKVTAAHYSMFLSNTEIIFIGIRTTSSIVKIFEDVDFDEFCQSPGHSLVQSVYPRDLFSSLT